MGFIAIMALVVALVGCEMREKGIHAKPANPPGTELVAENKVEIYKVGINGPEGMGEICYFEYGTGDYRRGQGYEGKSCQEYLDIVKMSRPYSLFCWISDPCSAPRPAGSQPPPPGEKANGPK